MKYLIICAIAFVLGFYAHMWLERALAALDEHMSYDV